MTGHSVDVKQKLTLLFIHPSTSWVHSFCIWRQILIIKHIVLICFHSLVIYVLNILSENNIFPDNVSDVKGQCMKQLGWISTAVIKQAHVLRCGL